MSWKKYFKVADLSGQLSPINGGRDGNGLPGYGKNDGRGTNQAETDFAFRNYMSIIEQRLSFADFTPAGNRVSFDLDDFLRGNPYERAQVYEILNRIGAMSIDEIREEEDMLL